jgi:error-prone DNA polymerase
VCYALGVTKADAVALGLLFERFLSPERDGPPDIDLDIEHQRREEVIQYVYERYGRDRAAQVANVITYRPRSALREMAKAAGIAPGQADALGKWVDRWAGPEAPKRSGADRQGAEDHRQITPRNERRFERTRFAPATASRDGVRSTAPRARPRDPAARARARGAGDRLPPSPRHPLGRDGDGRPSAGRVLPDRVGAHGGPSVLQWDKDDCAAAGS